MAETLDAQLTRTQAAIAAVEGGAQTARAADGRLLTYPDIKELYAREKSLLRRIAGASHINRTVSEC